VGLSSRIGLHTAEVDRRAGAFGTVAVSIAADVCDQAGDGEVLLSRTVRDLVAGSGVSLRDRGKIHLRTLGEDWRLFEATKGDFGDTR
jgi:class 3 adenylate cyclase